VPRWLRSARASTADRKGVTSDHAGGTDADTKLYAALRCGACAICPRRGGANGAAFERAGSKRETGDRVAYELYGVTLNLDKLKLGVRRQTDGNHHL
jgi:hypothetical protein